MPELWLLLILHGTVLCAAVLQAVTGIGFALLAGPVLLMVTGDTSALQVSILLNLVMALLMTPYLLRQCSWPHLRKLLLGTALGLPAGVALFALADLDTLKIATGALLLVVLVHLLARRFRPQTPTVSIGGKSAGFISGAMAGFAAMPGPAASAYLIGARDLDPRAIRATIFALFIGSYAAALGVHTATGQLQGAAFSMALALLPATLCGVAIGAWMAPRVRPPLFEILVIASLAVTAGLLLIG